MTIMETLHEALSQRVDDLIESNHRTRFLSTTGTRAALDELIRRNERLEQVVRELPAEVERLSEQADQH